MEVLHPNFGIDSTVQAGVAAAAHSRRRIQTRAINIEDERNGLIDEKTGALKVLPGILRSEVA
jgi:hypothetical protein